MKKFVPLTIAAFFLLGTVGLAQNYSTNDPGQNATSQTQDITVTIPERVAMHLTESSYSLDLNNPPAYDTTSNEGCRLLRKGQEHDVSNGVIPTGTLDSSGLASGYVPFQGVQLGSYLVLELLALNNPAVATYPAAVLTSGGNVATDSNGDYLKGTLVCFNRKTVQKFSNAASGWKFSADVTMSPGVGQFGIIDRTPGYLPAVSIVNGQNESDYRHLLNSTSTGLMLAKDSHPTGGWLDDNITELFWFDGSETPGTKTITVTYTLTGSF